MSDPGKEQRIAAFEVKKGPRRVLTLSEEDVEKYLDPQELLAGLEDGFCGLELGEVQAPPRPKLLVPGKGFSLAMPAWRPGMQVTVKIVNVFDGNLQMNLPNHLALVNLFDPGTGATSCVMDGTYIRMTLDISSIATKPNLAIHTDKTCGFVPMRSWPI